MGAGLSEKGRRVQGQRGAGYKGKGAQGNGLTHGEFGREPGELFYHKDYDVVTKIIHNQARSSPLHRPSDPFVIYFAFLKTCLVRNGLYQNPPRHGQLAQKPQLDARYGKW